MAHMFTSPHEASYVKSDWLVASARRAFPKHVAHCFAEGSAWHLFIFGL